MATLIKAISDSDTTLMFTEDINFPLVSATILIGTEQITYDSNFNGTLYGCVRGANSSSAAAHSAGASISLVDFYHAMSGESGSFTSVTLTGSTASRALTTDASKVITASATTSTELGYVNGVTSAIQTQINTKQPTISAVTSAASAGGGASESLTVAGLLTTSTIYSVSMKAAGANADKVVTGWTNSVNGQIALTFTADPGAGLRVLVAFR